MMKKLLAIAAIAGLAGCELPPPAADIPAPLPPTELPVTDLPAPDAGEEQAIPTDIVTAL